MQSAPATEVRIEAGVNSTAAAPGPADGPKSRKPANTKFKQQQLPAWQPMLTARSVLPFLVAIGLAFIPIGIALYLSATNVMEVMTEYTDCMQHDESGQVGGPCANGSMILPHCKCRVEVTLERPMGGPVFLYYAMDNFFQNHRKYVKSRDDNQLMGDFKAPSDFNPSTDCAPFAKANNSHGYAPCGAIANSLFNDTIWLLYNGPADAYVRKDVNITLERTNIAWKSDKQVKFRNPDIKDGTLKSIMEERKLVSPKNWQRPLWELDTLNEDNNGMQNEDLIVWMRTAAFPSFRKLYRRINHTEETFRDGLPAGNYTFVIEYNYPVKVFDGKKYVVLSSVSWIGGRNTFLGIAYMTVGSCCIVLAAIFFFIHIKWGRKGGDYENCRALARDVGYEWPENEVRFNAESSKISIISKEQTEIPVGRKDELNHAARSKGEETHSGTEEKQNGVTFEFLQSELLVKASKLRRNLSLEVSSGDGFGNENVKSQYSVNQLSISRVRVIGAVQGMGIGLNEDQEQSVVKMKETPSRSEVRSRRRTASVQPVLID